MNIRTKKLTTVAMLSAIAYTVMVLGRFPVVMFLKYDPKDIVITLGGLIWGPLTAFVVSVIVSFIEMLTVSETGIIGLVMNIISSCAFACTASAIYKHKRTLSGAVVGLLVGSLVMTSVMLLWNYLVTPIYLGAPREEVVKLLIPAFLPFNLLKSGLNAAVSFLLYKPVIGALRKSGYVSAPSGSVSAKRKAVGPVLIAAAVLASCVLAILSMQGII